MPRPWPAAIATFAAVGCIAALAFVIPLHSIAAPRIWHVTPHSGWTVLVLTLAGGLVGAPTWMAFRNGASGPAGALAAGATVVSGLAVASLGWRSANLQGLVIDTACLAGIATPLGAAVTLWLPGPLDLPSTAAPAGPFAPPSQDEAPPWREGFASAALWFACVNAGIVMLASGSSYVPDFAVERKYAVGTSFVLTSLLSSAVGGAIAQAPAWVVLRRAGVWGWPAGLASGYAGFATSFLVYVAVRSAFRGGLPVGTDRALPEVAVGLALITVALTATVGTVFALVSSLLTIRRAKRHSG